MPFIPPKTLISEIFAIGTTFVSANITLQFIGTLKFEITADATSPSPRWDEVALVSGVESSQIFTVSGNNVQYRIIGNAGVIIQPTTDDFGDFAEPGIKIQLVQ